LAVIGTGDAVSILAKLATQISIEVTTASPEAARVAALKEAGLPSEHLTHLTLTLGQPRRSFFMTMTGSLR
jgi:hypothetical protein